MGVAADDPRVERRKLAYVGVADAVTVTRARAAVDFPPGWPCTQIETRDQEVVLR